MSQSTTTSPDRRKPFTSSVLYHNWYQRVATGDPNDYIIAISAHPQYTGVTGSGKTTLGLDLAKNWLDASDGGFDAKTQATLDPQELTGSIYPETGAGGVMIYDEAQGTPSTTGLNSKRAMKEESLNAVLNIATRRMERKTLIIISQSLKSLVTDLYQHIDSWLLIMDDYEYRAGHYGVHPDVFNLEKNTTKTPGIEPISWQRIPKDDPDYKEMSRMKQEANEQQNSEEEEEDDSLTDEQQEELAQSLLEQNWSYREISNHPMIDYKKDWIAEHTKQAPTQAD